MNIEEAIEKNLNRIANTPLSTLMLSRRLTLMCFLLFALFVLHPVKTLKGCFNPPGAAE